MTSEPLKNLVRMNDDTMCEKSHGHCDVCGHDGVSVYKRPKMELWFCLCCTTIRPICGRRDPGTELCQLMPGHPGNHYDKIGTRWLHSCDDNLDGTACCGLELGHSGDHAGGVWRWGCDWYRHCDAETSQLRRGRYDEPTQAKPQPPGLCAACRGAGTIKIAEGSGATFCGLCNGRGGSDPEIVAALRGAANDDCEGGVACLDCGRLLNKGGHPGHDCEPVSP